MASQLLWPLVDVVEAAAVETVAETVDAAAVVLLLLLLLLVVVVVVAVAEAEAEAAVAASLIRRLFIRLFWNQT